MVEIGSFYTKIACILFSHNRYFVRAKTLSVLKSDVQKFTFDPAPGTYPVLAKFVQYFIILLLSSISSRSYRLDGFSGSPNT